ncbi:aa3-type cytochrome c oxidase subunit IV [Hyphomicrobium sp.]|nr:aa3-type cytochrome c oxidase subunit IV [Hyphomicrobium sp.]HET6390263.1 aa3-type cytochrome c oxidase subunit IV [Hyphomicrobium sp.]
MKVDTSKGNPSMDYAQHVDTYELFVRMTKYGTALVIVILAGMSYFLV